MEKKNKTQEETILSFPSPRPDMFYLLTNQGKIKETFSSTQLFDRPTYAVIGYQGNRNDLLVRVLQIMFPNKIEIEFDKYASGSLILGYSLGKIGNPIENFGMMYCTADYRLIHPKRIENSSIWKQTEPTYLNYFPIRQLLPHQIGQFNSFNLISSNINKLSTTDGDWITSHLLLESCLLESNITKDGILRGLNRFSLGYHRNQDAKFVMKINPSIIDKTSKHF